MIPVNEPVVGAREMEYVEECLKTGWISSAGRFISEFEKTWANYCGVEYGIAVSNGTLALQVALRVIELEPGDEVIMPSFTIISCALGVLYNDAIPVLVDCDPVMWCMNVSQIEEKITDRTRSILEAVGDPVEIIVVDDDSPDGTWSIVKELDDPRIKVIRREGTRGLATAIHRGIIESRGELVGWMDADMSMPADRLPIMIELTEQYPVVVGSRYVDGGMDDRPQFRVVTSRMINWLAGVVLGGGIQDYDSGFIMLRREVFDRVTLLPIGYGAYFIDFLHTCRKKGVNVLEIPYALVDRTRGSSKSMP